MDSPNDDYRMDSHLKSLIKNQLKSAMHLVSWLASTGSLIAYTMERSGLKIGIIAGIISASAIVIGALGNRLRRLDSNGSFKTVDIAVAAFSVIGRIISEWYGNKLNPERLGELLKFFLPPSIRKECFEPYFEELKEDRLDAASVANTPFSKFIVEIGFQIRLWVAYLASLICWFRRIFPLGEVFRSFFKTGGQ